jgi:hypothetical protein
MRRFESMKIKVDEGSAGFETLNIDDYEGIANCMPCKGSDRGVA